MTSLYRQMVGSMKEYKMTVRVPEAYRRHISILQGNMRKNSNDEVIRELIDKELASMFTIRDSMAISF